MKKVLIIDDNKDILEILELIFKSQGHETCISPTPVSWEELIRFQPDIVILDNWLQGKKGSDFCKEIKAHTLLKDIAVYLISAADDLSLVARECGADGYIRKPFQLADIESITSTYPAKL